MRTGLLTVCLLAAASPEAPGAAQAPAPSPLVLTLRDAERLAFRNNPRVAEARANLELAEARRAQASHAGILPTLNLRNIWGPVPRARGVLTESGVLTSPDTNTGFSDLRWFTEVQLDVLQPIWTFGKLSSATRAARYGVDAGEAGVAGSQAEVQLQVRKLYWGVVLGTELLRVADDVRREVEEAYHKLQAKFDEGSDEVTQNDLLKFQVFRYNIDKRYREAVSAQAVGKAALRAAIGLGEAVPFELATQTLAPVEVPLDSLPTYLAEALRQRPELTQLRAASNARSALVGVSSSDYAPQLFFGAQVRYNRAPSRFDPKNPFVYNPTNFFRPGLLVGLNWNVNFLQTRDRVRVAQLEQATLLPREPLLDAGIRLEVMKAYQEAADAAQSVHQSETASKASESWLRSEAQTFDLGLGDVKDVIDAYGANSSMRAEHLQNIHRLNTAVAELSKAIGRDLYPQ